MVRLKDGKTVTLDYGRSELLSILHGKVEDYDSHFGSQFWL
jgi:hypothetical protein